MTAYLNESKGPTLIILAVMKERALKRHSAFLKLEGDRMNKVVMIIVAILSMAAVACGKTEQAADQGQVQVQARKGAPASASTLSADAEAEARRMLEGYDTVHAKLAADSTDGITVAAARIQQFANQASAAAPPGLQPHFQAVASAAESLKQAPATDIEATRKAFGTVSNKVVALLSAEPSLASGRVVFECPMTPNYKKWVQTDKAVKNPHYGKKMLECGVASHWKV